MNEKITTEGILPIFGISRFSDEHGNSIQGTTLNCKGDEDFELALKEAVAIYAKLSPYSSAGGIKRNLLNFREVDLSEDVSPLQSQCDETSRVSKFRGR